MAKRKNRDGMFPAVFADTGDMERHPNNEGGMSGLGWFGHPVPMGTPTELQWQGALRYVIAKAHHRGGLRQGRGAQAEVGRWIHDWFSITYNRHLGETVVKDQVKLIFEEVAKVAKSPPT